MQPLVSILIPAYNAEDWIAQTLQSVLKQTWLNIEVIVVDDGSSDNTFNIAKQFESAIVKVYSQPNQGAAAARNYALRQAQGDFIQFLDADDLLAIDKIEQQMQLLLSTVAPGEAPTCIASGPWARFYLSAEEAEFIPQPLWRDFAPIDWLVCAWEGHWMMHPAAWLVPRAIAEVAGPWDEALSLNDDGEYFARVILASSEVKFCATAKSYYRSGISGSLSDRKSDAAYRSAYRAIAAGNTWLLAAETSPRTRKVCATQFQRFIYETYPAVPELRQQAAQWVRQLGGSDLKPTGGPLFQKLSKFLGWRFAKQIQQWIYQQGYRRWQIQRKSQAVIANASTKANTNVTAAEALAWRES